jgi:hypothetical protein
MPFSNSPHAGADHVPSRRFKEAIQVALPANGEKPSVEISADGFYQLQISDYWLVTRAAVATATTTAAAIFAGLGFVDVQSPSGHVLTIELLDSSSAFFLR